MIYYARLKDAEHKVEIEKEGESYKVIIDGKDYLVDAKILDGPTTLSLVVGNRCYEVAVTNSGDVMHIATGGDEFEVELKSQLEYHRKASAARVPEALQEEIKAPMPGVVVSVEVAEGQIVEPSSPVVIVEAMKMQNEISTLSGGRVKSILVKPGDVVDSRQTLVVIDRS